MNNRSLSLAGMSLALAQPCWAQATSASDPLHDRGSAEIHADVIPHDIVITAQRRRTDLLTGVTVLTGDALASEMRRLIGSDVALAYAKPWLAGGATTTPADHARMLRGILGGRLPMRNALGAQATCTNPSTCANALFTPWRGESPSYSIGHWVETDPAVGDGAFSSAGANGFYPWIDAGKTLYGVVARHAGLGGAVDSVYCGRLIRKAWVTAKSQ